MDKEFILDLFKDINLGEISEDIWSDNIEYDLAIDGTSPYYTKNKAHLFDIKSGATKGVIVPVGADYVIKVPFKGGYDDYYYTDEETEEEMRDWRFMPFEFARCECEDGGHWDYCLDETYYYAAAKAEGIEEFFCETKLLGYSGGHPVYVQQRAETFHSNNCKVSSTPDSVQNVRVQCIKNGWYCFNSCWCDQALQCYGEEKFNKFMQFLKKYHICDLHDGNIGYTIDGMPVLFDYSSYNE